APHVTTPIDTEVFVDDFNVEVAPGSWAKFGVSYGFVAAIVPFAGLALVEQSVDAEIARARAAGVRVDELHGKDIVAGGHGWRNRSIEERVSVIKRLLVVARAAGAHFV